MPFQAGEVEIGGGELFLIAGPCVIESEEHALHIAREISAVAHAAGVPYIFKASYDKANRTSLQSFRGPGVKEGARILRRIRDELKLPVLTDVHEPSQVAAIAESVDVIQIPAFLCRQTDLLLAAGKSGRAVNIKKGQFVAPWDMQHAVEKVRSTGNQRVFLTERGSSFGYNNLVVDMRSLAIMRRFAPVVFDGTHSVQLPSAQDNRVAQSPSAVHSSVEGHGFSRADTANKEKGASAPEIPRPTTDDLRPTTSGGQPQFIPLLTRAAVAAGVDGIFLEVHDHPACAKSDAANALDLKLLPALLRDLLAIHQIQKTKSQN